MRTFPGEFRCFLLNTKDVGKRAVDGARILMQYAHSVAKMKLRSCLPIIVFWGAVALNPATVQTRELAGVSMPDVSTVAGRHLRLNGMGVGTKVFVKVYVIGLYLERPTRDPRTTVETDEAKRIVLTMLRDVSRVKFVQAVEKDMTRNSGEAVRKLRTRLDRLENALPALKKGSVIDFTYLPGVGTVVRGEGKELTIAGKDFADALFSVWLGSKPTNAPLQRDLLGL